MSHLGQFPLARRYKYIFAYIFNCRKKSLFSSKFPQQVCQKVTYLNTLVLCLRLLGVDQGLLRRGAQSLCLCVDFLYSTGWHGFVFRVFSSYWWFSFSPHCTLRCSHHVFMYPGSFYIFVCHPSIIEQDALKHKMLTKDKIKYMILNHKLCWFSYTVIAQCKLTRHWMWRPLLSVCTVLNIVNVSIYCYWLLS